MYTIESLSDSVDKISRLRHLLENLPPEKYNHQHYRTRCKAPSCALGWAGTIIPEVNELLDNFYYGNRNILIFTNDTSRIFNFSRVFTKYLFAYNYYRKHKGVYISYFSRVGDHSLETTLRRIKLVEDYMRRRLATLLAEQEEINRRRIARKTIDRLKKYTEQLESK